MSRIAEIEGKTILRRFKRIDSWFCAGYGMNLYRGCVHNCIYCDGRTEKYYVEGEFGTDVSVKINAIEILQKELDPSRKRKPFGNSYFLIGGGVGDSYQPVEQEYGLTRQTLKLMEKFQYPVHILTKSTLVERDVDLLLKIRQRRPVIISFSFSSVQDDLAKILEPRVPPPSERLAAIARLKKQGFVCGMFLMPIVPLVTDTPELLDAACARASKAGVDFLLFAPMTLKDGRQKDYFMQQLVHHFPELNQAYHMIYAHDPWGNPDSQYSDYIHQVLSVVCRKYKIPKRIPSRFFHSVVNPNDLVAMILEQMDYLYKIKGYKSPYGYAARSIARMDRPLVEMKNQLRSINGVGKETEKIVKEILATRTCAHYESLLIG